jgi:hypothetical protein
MPLLVYNMWLPLYELYNLCDGHQETIMAPLKPYIWYIDVTVCAHQLPV